MTQILKLGGLLLVALAVLFGWRQFAAAQTLRTFSPRDDLVKAIQSNKDADDKLKHSYQALVDAYKQAAAVSNELGRVKDELRNRKLAPAVRGQLKSEERKLEADYKKRQAAVNPVETAFVAQQTSLLARLNKSCVPVLQGLTKGLDGSTLETIDSLLDLFVLGEQKEIPRLRIGASFVDQDVWKEASKCMTRHGVDHLAELRKMLVSKNPAAKYAAASALGELGEQVYRLDRSIYQQLLFMSSTLKKTTMDSSEKRTRQKILDTAMESLVPMEKK